MKVYDYRIEECFDFNEMRTYYTIQKYSVAQEEYVLYSPKRFGLLSQAKEAIRMLRRYKEPIYHYPEWRHSPNWPLTSQRSVVLSYNNLTNIELMNPTLLLLISNDVSITSVIGATILAVRGTEVWGWFLLVVILCSTTPTITNTLWMTLKNIWTKF